MELKLLSPSYLAFVFCFLAVLHETCGSLEDDGEVLLDFAASVPHVRKLNWNPSTSICSHWSGIKCSKDGKRVIGIHLPGIGFFGQIGEKTLGKIKTLRVLSLRGNHLSGTLPSDILSIPSLKFVYLQNNNFIGKIPSFLSHNLVVLDLSGNSFKGEIPATISNLAHLSALLLQNNFLSGSIPNLQSANLTILNLSHNSLNGSIPDSLQTFSESSFQGNTDLCGKPLRSCPPPVSEKPKDAIFKKKEKKKLSAGMVIAIAIGGLSFAAFLALMVSFVFKKRVSDGSEASEKVANSGRSAKPEDFGSGVQDAEKNKLVFFEGCSYSFDLEDLLRASAEVLGKGSYGTAYKACLDESTMVVVKRLREVGVGKREFEQHMEVLGRIGRSHPNILSPKAYYFSKDEKLVVHEYMPVGSLFEALHGNRSTERSPLDWRSRMNIALGTARGIAHIHAEGGVRFTHGNIKSSNVLLTANLTACVSDFGLSPVMNYIAVKHRGPGYRSPEMIETRKVTQKSDVYGFGVLLLELLTGKSPVQDEVVDLPRWVRSVIREEWTAEVFDVELLRFCGGNVEEDMVAMLQVALACVARVQDARPAMAEVVRMIEDVVHQVEASSDDRSRDSYTPATERLSGSPHQAH